MARKKKKINILPLTIIIVAAFLLLHTNSEKENASNVVENIPAKNHNIYANIAENKNANYTAEGKVFVEGKDGYTSIFHTPNKKYKEYKQNIGSWKDNSYWQDNMTESGCGITSLSIILSGYGKNYTPETLRKKYYPRLDSASISSELRGYGITNTDFYYDKVRVSKDNIISHLLKDKPILICTWTKNGENRWTTTSHYMVLLATDGFDKVYISNPNGLENTEKASGWYDISEVLPYIAKALFITK